MEYDRALFHNTCAGLASLGYGSIIVSLKGSNTLRRYSFFPGVSIQDGRAMYDRTGRNSFYDDLPGANNLRLSWEDFVRRFVDKGSKTKRLINHLRSLNET